MVRTTDFWIFVVISYANWLWEWPFGCEVVPHCRLVIIASWPQTITVIKKLDFTIKECILLIVVDNSLYRSMRARESVSSCSIVSGQDCPMLGSIAEIPTFCFLLKSVDRLPVATTWLSTGFSFWELIAPVRDMVQVNKA